MSILSDITEVLTPLGIPFETGEFSGKAPDTYIVVVPLTDSFVLDADDLPSYDEQSARISIFCKGNYLPVKYAVQNAILAAGLTITERGYIGYEPDTGYHHYNIDAAHIYELEES